LFNLEQLIMTIVAGCEIFVYRQILDNEWLVRTV